MAKKRIKAAATVYVPQSKDEVQNDIREIGDISRKNERLETEMNDRIAEITNEYAPKFEVNKVRLELLTKGVQSWCEANRDDLTNSGKVKSANLVTGKVEWRQRPPSISVKGVDAVIEWLQDSEYQRFLRTKVEVNKEAMLNEPDDAKTIPGITIKSGIEDFAVTPFEQEAGV